MLGKILVALVVSASGAAAASIDIWVDDTSGMIGRVNPVTGAVTIVGNSGVQYLTDIAFDQNGNLFGVDYSRLFSINTSNGLATLIGPLTIPLQVPLNSLTFSPNNVLYAASNILYTVNTNTGLATPIGPIGYSSAGDLAFLNGILYLTTTNGELVKLNPTNGAATYVGNTGLQNVWGLAAPGNGLLYAVSGTNLYSIDPGTAVPTFDVSWAGSALGPANGGSSLSGIPEPGSMTLLAVGLAALAAAAALRCRLA